MSRALRAAWANVIRRPRLTAAIVVGVALVILPSVLPNAYQVHVITVGLIYAILAASWDLLYGIGGVLSFAQASFFGIGAYAYALLNVHYGLNPWAGLIVAGVAASLLGIVFSFASIRLRGTYLALSTLAFAQTLQIIDLNFVQLTRGTLGLSGYDTLTALEGTDAGYYYFGLVLMAVLVGGMWWLGRRTSWGLAWRAIKADPSRAETVGINVPLYRMLVFVIGSFAAGVAGAFYADYLIVITPSELDASLTAMVIAMAIIGGAGTIVGPAVAGFLVQVLSEYLRFLGGALTLVALGLLIVVFVIFLPGGFAQLLGMLAARIRPFAGQLLKWRK